MKLYNFFRSGTSHRTRIALNLKGLNYEYVEVNLRENAHRKEAFKSFSPQQLVPVLETGEHMLVQSPAIIEWLEERYPNPPLLPQCPEDRARVRAMAAIPGCDVHPLNNKRVLDYLRTRMGCDDTAVEAWCSAWISAGFDALEIMLAADPERGRYCFADSPSLADVYLIPQVESARRFNINLERWPLIRAVDAACGELAAFRQAAPALQPDAPQ